MAKSIQSSFLKPALKRSANSWRIFLRWRRRRIAEWLLRVRGASRADWSTLSACSKSSCFALHRWAIEWRIYVTRRARDDGQQALDGERVDGGKRLLVLRQGVPVETLAEALVEVGALDVAVVLERRARARVRWCRGRSSPWAPGRSRGDSPARPPSGGSRGG